MCRWAGRKERKENCSIILSIFPPNKKPLRRRRKAPESDATFTHSALISNTQLQLNIFFSPPRPCFFPPSSVARGEGGKKVKAKCVTKGKALSWPRIQKKIARCSIVSDEILRFQPTYTSSDSFRCLGGVAEDEDDPMRIFTASFRG